MGQLMGLRSNRILSSQALGKITAPGLYYVGGVPNLALLVSKEGSRSWILRYTFAGRRRDMGLGPYPEVSLSVARDTAFDKRHLLRRGIDPIQERRATISQLRTEKSANILFKDAAEKFIESKRSGWKNVKHACQWQSTLRDYANPVIGNKRAREITLQDILDILEPIWTVKTETAKKVQGRIENILDWCRVKNFREGDNPAKWRGNLDKLLAAPNKIQKVQHHKSLDWGKCPEFYRSLLDSPSTSYAALRFCILTACRSGEVRGASWAEIDLDREIWIIPAQRMKAEREHRVPLSKQAITLLRNLPRFKNESLVFPNASGKPLSDMALLEVVRGMKEDFTVHGFRSSFRDWAGESTLHSREVIEHALAHQLKNKAEAAYARGDLLAKRKILMNDWADHLCPPSRHR